MSAALRLFGSYFAPGARYCTAFLTAWSTSSGVIRTAVLTRTAPLDPTVKGIRRRGG
jgi:hypothetical protein